MIDDRWWLLEPHDRYLEMNDDDIEEMKFNSGIEEEEEDEEEEEPLDAMTLAKSFKEDEMIREMEERERGE